MSDRYTNREAAGTPSRAHGQTHEASPQTSATDTSIARLMGEIVADAQHLIRKEVELAKQEIRREINKVVRGGISLGAGAIISAISALFLLTALVYGLVEAFGIAFWLSYLIVGGVLLIIGGILLMVGRSRIAQVDPLPRETVDSVRKDAQWIREQNPLNEK